MVAGLLAAGLPPLDAASAAAFVHGIAGRLAADGAAVTASDVLAALPDAVRAVSRP
jgi:NAD(P)H-hydrate repair Nnr-like enzyme with NAD(P)H-hydrate dehydratase domain